MILFFYFEVGVGKCTRSALYPLLFTSSRRSFLEIFGTLNTSRELIFADAVFSFFFSLFHCYFLCFMFSVWKRNWCCKMRIIILHYLWRFCGQAKFRNFVGIYFHDTRTARNYFPQSMSKLETLNFPQHKIPFNTAQTPLLKVWKLIWKCYLVKCHHLANSVQPIAFLSTVFLIFICFFINCSLF